MERQFEEADPNAAAELQAMQQQKEAALAQLLTEKEREQYDLWFSRTAMQTREAIFGMNASEEEFLKVYNLRREFDAKYSAGAPPEALQELNTQLQRTLGAERYADYARAQDPDYRTLFAVTTRFGLPQKLAVELHDFKQVAREHSEQVNADVALTSLQKQAAQQAIREETDRAYKEALGDRAFRYFAKRAAR
jgi:hypothetical protein